MYIWHYFWIKKARYFHRPVLCIAQHITSDSYIPCLADLCKALWEVMLSYYRTMDWHEKYDHGESPSSSGRKYLLLFSVSKHKNWSGAHLICLNNVVNVCPLFQWEAACVSLRNMYRMVVVFYIQHLLWLISIFFSTSKHLLLVLLEAINFYLGIDLGV